MGGRGSGGGRSGGGGGARNSQDLLPNETINKYANNKIG